MSYCPLSCSSHGYMPSCKGPECELTDEAGDCLIKQALACYVQDKREQRAARESIAKGSMGLFGDLFGEALYPKQYDSFGSVKTSEPATGAQKLKEMRSDDPIPPRYY